jgi:Heat induced stress protein YflT domain
VAQAHLRLNPSFASNKNCCNLSNIEQQWLRIFAIILRRLAIIETRAATGTPTGLSCRWNISIKSQERVTIMSKEQAAVAPSDRNSAVAIYDTHLEAESAIKELQKAGFDMKHLSIVGKDYHSEENVVTTTLATA